MVRVQQSERRFDDARKNPVPGPTVLQAKSLWRAWVARALVHSVFHASRESNFDGLSS